MRTFGWLLLWVFAAYCADAYFYGGVYTDTVLTVMRHVTRGVLMGLGRHA